MLQKIWVWCRRSATIVVARAQVIAAALFEIVYQAVVFLGAANVSQFLPPRWLTLYLCVSGVVTELARRRTLAKE